MPNNNVLKWIATSFGTWDTAANWSTDTVPNSLGAVTIDAASVVQISGSADQAASLTIDHASNVVWQVGTLTLTGRLDLGGFMIAGASYSYDESETSSIVAPGGVTIEPGGELQIRGPTTITGNVVNNSNGYFSPGEGGVEDGYTLHITGALSGSGSTMFSGLLELGGAASQPLEFDDGGYGDTTLQLDAPGLVSAAISGVTPGNVDGTGLYGTYVGNAPNADIIDLSDIPYASVASVTYVGTTLTVTETGGQKITLDVIGRTANALYDATPTPYDDLHGGTAVAWQVGLTDTWISPGGGDWSTSANWSLGFPPGQYDTAILGGGGTVTVAAGTSAQAHALTMADSTTTLAVAGGLALYSSPSFDATEVTVTGGEIDIIGGGGIFDNATIMLADGELAAVAEDYETLPSSGPNYVLGPDLTLGSSLLIVQQPGTANGAVVSAGYVTNDGTIIAAAGGSFAIAFQLYSIDGGTALPEGSGLTNAGSILVGTGESFFAAGGPADFSNAAYATLTLDDGAYAALGGESWGDAGFIDVGAGATLVLEGDFDPSSIPGISNQGGTVVLEGIPSMSGPIAFNGGLWVIDPSYALPAVIGIGTADGSGQNFTNADLTIGTDATLELRGVPPTYYSQPNQDGIGSTPIEIAPGYATNGSIAFAAGATLILDQPGEFSGTLSGLAFTNVIDFASVDVTSASFSANGLTIDANGQIYNYDVDYNGQTPFWADEVGLASDGAGGTDLSLHPDTIPPAVTAISAQASNGATDLDAGTVISITLDLRETVIVTGTPTLDLSDGATAAYQAGSDTSEIIFTTTAEPGQNSPDLAVVGFDFSGGAIADLGGNPLPAALPASVSTTLGLQIDTIPPSIVAVAATPGTGVLQPGQTISITVRFSEPVTLSGGPPTLTLSTGGTAVFDAAATTALGNPAELVFQDVVGQIDASSTDLTVTGFQTNGATITDLAGNPANLSAIAGDTLGVGVDTASMPTATEPVYFVAGNNASGYRQVYVTDGTPGGTDILGASLGYIDSGHLTPVAGGAYFTALVPITETIDNGNDFENSAQSQIISFDDAVLVETDGTSAGTTIVWEVSAPLSYDSFYQTPGTAAFTGIAAFGGGLLVAEDILGPDNNDALQRTDTVGLYDGTSLTTLYTLSDHYLSSTDSSDANSIFFGGSFFVAGSLAYFLAPLNSLNNDSNTAVLWQTNGTALGTVQDTLIGPDGPIDPTNFQYSGDSFTDFTTSGDTLYFLYGGSLFEAADGGAPGELTSAGQPNGFSPVTMVADGAGGLYFVDTSGALWHIGDPGTGTAPQELLPSGTFIGAQDLVLVGNTLFMIADAPGTSTLAVIATNGTAGGTSVLTAIDGSVGAPSSLTAAGDQVFFVANDATDLTRLWRSDGTAAGTEIVSPTGDTLIDPADLTADGTKLFFQGYDGANGVQLWQSDGTSAGTTLVDDIATGSQSNGNASTPIIVGNIAFFTDFDPVNETTMLWSTDGTAAGTHVVLPANGGGYSAVTNAVAFAGKVYFTSTEPSGNALWMTDGTAAGTVKIGDIGDSYIAGVTSTNLFLANSESLEALTAGSSTPAGLDAPVGVSSFVAIGSKLYFISGGQIWQSNGTAVGTAAVAGASGAFYLTAAGTSLYYMTVDADGVSIDLDSVQSGGGSATSVKLPNDIQINNVNGASNGVFLQTSQGLYYVEGTTLTSLVSATGTSFRVESAAAIGADLVFLGVNNDTSTTQLWTSNGTVAGTKAISGALGIIDPTLSVSGNEVYFTADNSSGQSTLWRSDGTSAGTGIVSSGLPVGFYSGIATLGSHVLASTGNQLYGVAGSPATATQLTDITIANGAYPSDIVAGTPPATVAGVAEDGYIAGATVFADANGNGVLDPGEASATTDAHGNFSLTGGSGPLVLIGGTDTATNLAFTGTLTAPAGSSVVTPLTTLVETLASGSSPLSVPAAELAVESAFGITLAAGSSLDGFDPIAGLFAGTEGANAAFAAGTQVLDSVTMAAAALGGLDPTLSSAAAQADVLASIAAQIAAAPSASLDFSNAVTVAGLVTNAASLDPTFSSTGPADGAVSDIASVIAASNAVTQQDETAATPSADFVDTSAAARVAQGGATTALSDPAAAVTQYTGSALTQAVATAVTEVTPCFCPGTMILTPGGERPIETLRAGEEVVTVSGRARKIRWIGRRAYAARLAAGRRDILPIRIKAGALAEGVPRRDLLVSPLHALLFGAPGAGCVLVPAGALVNGRSIEQVAASGDVRYLHIELSDHDVIIADGAPAETYIDDGNRAMFHNAREYRARHGDATPGSAIYCAPRLETGARVDTIWRDLDARARRRDNLDDDLGSVDGFLDRVSPDGIRGGWRVAGWACQRAAAEAPVCLDIRLDGRLLAQTVANEYRGDLERAGIGGGRHSFTVRLPDELTWPEALRLEACRSSDGARLPRSDAYLAAVVIDGLFPLSRMT